MPAKKQAKKPGPPIIVKNCEKCGKFFRTYERTGFILCSECGKIGKNKRFEIKDWDSVYKTKRKWEEQERVNKEWVKKKGGVKS